MTKQVINTGSAANDGTGDPLRTSFGKANDNFTELYDLIPPPSNLIKITDISQFAISGGKYVIENDTYYEIGVSILEAVLPFDLSAITNSSTFDIKYNKLKFTGDGGLFQGAYSGLFTLQQALIDGDGTNDFWGLNGNGNPGSNILITNEVIASNFKSRGVINNVGAVNHKDLFYSDCGEGLLVKNVSILSYRNSPIANNISSNTPSLILDGTFFNVFIQTNPITINSGESFIKFSPDINVIGKISVEGNSFSNAIGGEFLSSAFDGNVTSVLDNGSGLCRMTMTSHGITIEQKIILSEFIDQINYNGTFDIINVIDANTIDVNVLFSANDTGNYSTGDSNILLDDNSFQFRNNGDQIDSNEITKYVSVNPILVAISNPSTDGSNAVHVAGSSADWLSSIDRRFEMQFVGDPNGSSRYIGSKVLPFRISARLTVDAQGGSSREMTGYINVNGDVKLESKFTVDSAKLVTLNPEDIVTLNPGDVVGVSIENNEDTTNINVMFVNINIIKA